jgi:hypothetical protein
LHSTLGQDWHEGQKKKTPKNQPTKQQNMLQGNSDRGKDAGSASQRETYDEQLLEKTESSTIVHKRNIVKKPV